MGVSWARSHGFTLMGGAGYLVRFCEYNFEREDYSA